MKKNKVLFFASSFVLILILLGCSTMIHGTRQNVGISSNPSGAKVTIDGQTFGNTPLIVELSRKDNHIIKIELEGYLPYETTLRRKVSAWVVGNIVFGGPIGLAIDAISGGMYELTPEQIQAELKKSEMGINLDDDKFYMMVTLTPDPRWKKIAQLKKK